MKRPETLFYVFALGAVCLRVTTVYPNHLWDCIGYKDAIDVKQIARPEQDGDTALSVKAEKL